MFCKHCGAECPNDAKFCPSCGGNIAQEQEQVPSETIAEEPKKTDYGTVGIVCGIIGIFFLGIVLGTLAIIFSGVAMSRHEKGGSGGLVLGIIGFIFHLFVLLVLFA